MGSPGRNLGHEPVWFSLGHESYECGLAMNRTMRFDGRVRGMSRIAQRVVSRVLHGVSVLDRAMRTPSVGQGSCWVRVAPASLCELLMN